MTTVNENQICGNKQKLFSLVFSRDRLPSNTVE